MSATKDRLKKRRPRKVTIEGDDYFVVSQTIAESEHVDLLAKDETQANQIIGYSLFAGLVEEDGSAVFESPEDPDIKLIPIETALILSQEIRKATTPQSFEAAKKN